jgi:hypothetical protein
MEWLPGVLPLGELGVEWPAAGRAMAFETWRRLLLEMDGQDAVDVERGRGALR